jgi:AcrR family transcriptional regulator
MNETVIATERKRRSDGERSRNAILHEAARLATVEGLSGLSIARLADAVGMSKSGLFAHFGSKEELQLATIEAAGVIFAAEVVDPALAEPTGIGRLRALAEGFLDYVGRQVFPGGCFFASVAAELDTHPGPVRDKAIEVIADWSDHLVAAARRAREEGALGPAEEVEQLAFEIDAYLLLANAEFVLSGEPAPLDRARRAIGRRLAEAGRDSGAIDS